MLGQPFYLLFTLILGQLVFLPRLQSEFLDGTLLLCIENRLLPWSDVIPLKLVGHQLVVSMHDLGQQLGLPVMSVFGSVYLPWPVVVLRLSLQSNTTMAFIR